MRSLALALFLVPALAFGQAIPPESGGGGSGVAEDLLTAEMDTTKHLVPDGAGGAEWLVPAAAAPAGHNTSHENGGADEIDVTGLVGLPAAYDGGAVTNPFLAPDGAVGAPSYSFSTDLDTGLWIDTDGGSNEELNFSVQGDRLFNLEQNAGGTTQRMAFNNAADETVFLCQGNATTKTCQVALFGIGGSAFYVEANATDTQITLGSSSGLRDARVTLWGTTAVIRWDPAITGTQYGEFVPLSAYTGARQYHLPDATGDMALLPASGASTFALATTLVTNEVDVANSVWGASNGLVFEGATGGADTFETTLTLVDPTADNVITLQNATGTVAFLSDVGGGGPTRVSQAANLVTSAVYTSADATNLLFTPANSTEYYIQGKVFVASDTVAYGVGFQFTFPTTDAIAGSCTAYIPKQTTAGDILTAPAASGATTSQISGANTVSPAGTVAVYTIDCYLSTTTNTSGNFAVLFGGENAGGSYTLYAGSYIDYEALP